MPSQRKPPNSKAKPKSSQRRKPPRVGAEWKRGFAAVAGAMGAAALTSSQNRQIVHHCIAACAGTNNFASNQPLNTIRPGIDPCVEACVIDAVHKTIIVRGTDTEDTIVARL